MSWFCPDCGCEHQRQYDDDVLCAACETSLRYEARIAELEVENARLWVALNAPSYAHIPFDETFSGPTDNFGGVLDPIGVTRLRDWREVFEGSLQQTYEWATAGLTRSATLEAEIAKLKDAYRWIPVKERVPADDQQVLCNAPLADPEVYYWSGSLLHPIDGSVPVTHWMPLPRWEDKAG